MYQIFTPSLALHTSTIRPPGLELLTRHYQSQVSSIKDYYASRVFAVSNSHLLVRILTTGGIPTWYPIDSYTEIAFSRSPYLAKHFNFTSDISYGARESNPVFYGPEQTEYILYTEEYFNPQDSLMNWRDLKPVEVLEHPITDLSLILPTGRNISTDKGLCVISINIPMLLVKYRGFIAEQAASMQEGGSRLGATHFVMRYVLPYMLESHIDIVIANRMMALYYGAPMGSSELRYPFPLSDYSSRLDSVLSQLLRHISNARLTYPAMLQYIPSYYHSSGRLSLQMPDISPTRQVWWLLLLSRLRMIKFLIDVGGTRALATNGSLVARLKIDLKRLLNENMIESMMPADMYFDTLADIHELMR